MDTNTNETFESENKIAAEPQIEVEVAGTGAEQIEAQNYEKYDKVSASTRFWSSGIGKVLKKIGDFLMTPVVVAMDALRKAVLVLALSKTERQAFYKEEEKKALIDARKKTVETPVVANEKMQIINNKELDNNQKIEQLANLCHRTGCEFYVVLNDKSAIKFNKHEKYVEMAFSEPPALRGKNKVETYLFGTTFGNIRYSTHGEIANGKIKDKNINTVLARIDERGGINTEIDSLKDTAVVTQIPTFQEIRDRTEYSAEPEKGEIEENPGHGDPEPVALRYTDKGEYYITENLITECTKDLDPEHEGQYSLYTQALSLNKSGDIKYNVDTVYFASLIEATQYVEVNTGLTEYEEIKGLENIMNAMENQPDGEFLKEVDLSLVPDEPPMELDDEPVEPEQTPKESDEISEELPSKDAKEELDDLPFITDDDAPDKDASQPEETPKEPEEKDGQKTKTEIFEVTEDTEKFKDNLKQQVVKNNVQNHSFDDYDER